MNKNIVPILNILLESKSLLSRAEIEDKMLHIKTRPLQKILAELEREGRVEILGQTASTVYQVSENYHKYFKEKLFLYQNQVLIGHLGYDRTLGYQFAYDTEYLTRSKKAVRFEMPLDIVGYEQQKCFVDFEETLPEGIDREILIEKAGNATEFFLLKNNNYSRNELIFSSSKITFEGEKKINTESFLESKSKILGSNKFPNVLAVDVDIDDVSLFPSKYMSEEEIKEVRTISISGFQHKIPAVIEKGLIRLPHKDEEVFYFVKPFHPLKADEENKLYFPHIAINEHLHMTFAKNELGFDVPESGIFKTEKDREYHYIVKYFDRYKSYKFQRKEFSTYLGLSSDDKYKISSEKLFERASKVFPREEDRIKMLEYYFYSFVIRHEDMHTKNISSIIDKDKTVIAPLYDISTTGFYGGIRNYESHLTINGKQTNIRLKDFLCLVKKANVSSKEFIKRAKAILEAYLDRMPRYIKKIAKLDQIDFYTKERPNAQDRKIKIKGCKPLDEVMLDAYYNRVDTLEKNLWLEQLAIENRIKKLVRKPRRKK